MSFYYDVIFIGAGPSSLYGAYQIRKNNPDLKLAIVEQGRNLQDRRCPIVGTNKSCLNCSSCSITRGFGGAGAFSDGKFNITNEFGGTLGNYIGYDKAMEMMEYVDSINCSFYPEVSELHELKSNDLYKKCLDNDMHLLSAKIRHLGTDINYKILSAIYEELKLHVSIYFERAATEISFNACDNGRYFVKLDDGSVLSTNYCVIGTGRSGSKWVEKQCGKLGIETKSNKVDIGVRVELPFDTFSFITDEAYEGKIVYRTKQYEDNVRTFCMNPHGKVVTENTNGIVTVNGHSYEDKSMFTNNTNFALLVNKTFTEPFKDSNEYGESIARLSNMLGGGVLVQRFGDLIRGRRSTKERIEKSFVKPTMTATPGDLSLVMPKRLLDDIIEMIYQLDKIAPGTANDDTLLYGVEVKFHNVTVDVDENLETVHPGIYIIGDCSGVTHSLSQASASGVFVANNILKHFSDRTRESTNE